MLAVMKDGVFHKAPPIASARRTRWDARREQDRMPFAALEMPRLQLGTTRKAGTAA